MTAQATGTQVNAVMSTPVLTVEIDESLWDAWQLLFVSGLRHLVVLDDDGACVGVISDRNILADIPMTPEHLGGRRLREVITPVPTLRVRPEDDPRMAGALMREHGVEAVPVVDANARLVGIVTESDLVRWLVE